MLYLTHGTAARLRSGLFLAAIVGLLILSMCAGCGTSQWSIPDGQAGGVVPYAGLHADGERFGYISETAPTWQQVTFDERGKPVVDIASPIQSAMFSANLRTGEVLYTSSGNVSLGAGDVVVDPETGVVTLTVRDFRSDKSAVLDSLAAQIDALTEQVRLGNLTQQEALRVMGTIAEAAIRAFAPVPPIPGG